MRRCKASLAQVQELRKIHRARIGEIDNRFQEFRNTWEKKSRDGILGELVFCLLTPQSKAKVCWDAATAVKRKGLFKNARAHRILACLKGVRFKYKKAKYAADALKEFSNRGKEDIKSRLSAIPTSRLTRDWLVKNIKGLGYKEASHFLRNIGKAHDLMILDRHILRNLRRLGVINAIPASLTKKKYSEIEEKMIEFAKAVGIPPGHLDFILWSRETGQVFK